MTVNFFAPGEPFDPTSNTNVKVIVENEEAELKNLEPVEMPKKGQPYSSLEYTASLNLDGPGDFSRNIEKYRYEGKSFEDE